MKNFEVEIAEDMLQLEMLRDEIQEQIQEKKEQNVRSTDLQGKIQELGGIRPIIDSLIALRVF